MAEKSHVIYVGPSLPKEGLNRWAVFRGGYPANISALIEAHPTAERLFVPVSELTAAREALKDSTSMLSVLGARLLAAYNKKGD